METHNNPPHIIIAVVYIYISLYIFFLPPVLWLTLEIFEKIMIFFYFNHLTPRRTLVTPFTEISI